MHVCNTDGSAFEKGNEELKKKAKELEHALVMNALALDGTASGEHGVGIHKIVSPQSRSRLIIGIYERRVR